MTISDGLAAFVDSLAWDEIPSEVVARARLLILDAVGIAYASSGYEFAHRALTGLAHLGQGDAHVIGFEQRLSLRDAVLMNGVLVHGLDYDDTHLAGVVHATSSCFPCALGVAAACRRSGRDLVAAYIAGMEVAARIGTVVEGELNQIGFHPTGVVGAFAAALVAGRLYGLGARRLSMAQGIVLSMASGTREYSTDGAWTKRLHPGWAGSAGITAAALAKSGFVGPAAAYEGRFGLYATHLHRKPTAEALGAATANLGTIWELMGVAVKPFPVCQYLIACIDAAIALLESHPITARDIEHVRVFVPQHAVIEVCEPAQAKKRPASSYAASFSVHYAVACALLRRTFGLGELECYEDPQIRALADRVDYAVDELSGYPKHFSAEVVLTMKDGTQYRRREQVNRGAPERPLSEREIVDKFMANASLAISRVRASEIIERVLHIDDTDDAWTLGEALARP